MPAIRNSVHSVAHPLNDAQTAPHGPGPYAKPPVSEHMLEVLRSRGVPYTSDTKTHLANSVVDIAARLVSNWPRLLAPVAGVEYDITKVDVSRQALVDALGGEDKLPGSSIPTEDQPTLKSARLYVSEVLRRSRSPYALLQMALFYMMRLRPVVLAGNATLQPSVLGCGRRMLLTSLILAGKYLHDRNFKTSAWSKICGLSAAEINGNELLVLGAMDWRLSVSPDVYEDWCNTVIDIADPFAGLRIVEKAPFVPPVAAHLNVLPPMVARLSPAPSVASDSEAEAESESESDSELDSEPQRFSDSAAIASPATTPDLSEVPQLVTPSQSPSLSQG